jgi:chromosome segregation ATPase
MKFFLRLIPAILVAALLGWSIMSEIQQEKLLSRLNDAEANVDAIADAQDFAMPLIGLSEQLARENAMFTQVIDRARDIVTAKDLELVQTKESLNSSIELLQEQIVENNRCVDEIRALESHIRALRRTVNELMSKIPDAGVLDYPYDPAYNN